MIILLYGSDDYRRRERERFYIGEFRKKYSGAAVERFRAGESGAEFRFQEFARSQSMFTKFKMAIVGDSYGSEDKGFIKELKSALKSGPETTVLISEQKAPSGAFVFLKKAATAEKFEPLSGDAWKTYVSSAAKMMGVTLTSEALSFISRVYEGDTWRLITEFEKLRFVPRSPIGKGNLEYFGLEVAPSFEELLYGLKSGNRSARFSALEKLFASHEPLPRMFYTIPYWMPEKLRLFSRYDIAVKSGKLEYEEALVDLVL